MNRSSNISENLGVSRCRDKLGEVAKIRNIPDRLTESDDVVDRWYRRQA